MDASLASSLTRYDSTEGDMRDTYLQQQPADEINSTRIGTDTDAFTRVDYRSLELEDMLDSIAADVDDISDSNSLWDDLLGEL